MKQLLLPIVAAAAFIIVVGILTKNSLNLKPSSSPTPVRKEIKVGNYSLNVEIADSEDERKKGLSGRNTLEENTGMLFSFGQENVLPSFWMKGMLIPIDIIWINDGKIAKIDKSVQPEPGKTDSDLSFYRPNAPIDFVLEVPAGFSGKNNIGVGDKVIIER